MEFSGVYDNILTELPKKKKPNRYQQNACGYRVLTWRFFPVWNHEENQKPTCSELLQIYRPEQDFQSKIWLQTPNKREKMRVRRRYN